MRDLLDLDEAARTALMSEIGRVGAGLRTWAQARGGYEKINVGIIGNIVPQLHIHVVARRKDDAAWPGVVWGAGQNLPYGAAELPRLAAEFRGLL